MRAFHSDITALDSGLANPLQFFCWAMLATPVQCAVHHGDIECLANYILLMVYLDSSGPRVGNSSVGAARWGELARDESSICSSKSRATGQHTLRMAQVAQIQLGYLNTAPTFAGFSNTAASSR